MVPSGRLELPHQKIIDFESTASTNSATRALHLGMLSFTSKKYNKKIDIRKMPSEKFLLSEFVEKFYVLKNSDIPAEIYFNKRVRPVWQAMTVRLMFGTLFLITRPKYMSETNVFSFSLASYIIHSGFLCIAMSHEGYPRYAMELWPALFVAISIAFDCGLSQLAQRKATDLHP